MIPSLGLRGPNMAKVLEHVAWEFGVDEAAIRGRSRRDWSVGARSAVVWSAGRHLRLAPEEVAAELGWHPARGAYLARRAEAMIAGSADWRRLFGCIDRALELAW